MSILEGPPNSSTRVYSELDIIVAGLTLILTDLEHGKSFPAGNLEYPRRWNGTPRLGPVEPSSRDGLKSKASKPADLGHFSMKPSNLSGSPEEIHRRRVFALWFFMIVLQHYEQRFLHVSYALDRNPDRNPDPHMSYWTYSGFRSHMRGWFPIQMLQI